MGGYLGRQDRLESKLDPENAQQLGGKPTDTKVILFPFQEKYENCTIGMALAGFDFRGCTIRCRLQCSLFRHDFEVAQEWAMVGYENEIKGT